MPPPRRTGSGPATPADARELINSLVEESIRTLGDKVSREQRAHIASWSAARRKSFLGYAVRRLADVVGKIRIIHPDPFRNPPKDAEKRGLLRLWAEQGVLAQVIDACIEGGWRVDGTLLDSILTSITRFASPAGFNNERLGSLVAMHADAYAPSRDAAPAVARILNEELMFWETGEQPGHSTMQRIATLQRVLGNAPLPLDPQFPAGALVLQQLGTDAPLAWVALVEHCLTFSGPRASRAWLARATKLLEPIRGEDFDAMVPGWLDAVRRPIEGPLTRGDWAISVQEEAWLGGIVWCAALRPNRATLDAIGRLCTTCLRPYEHSQRSRLLTMTCVNALDFAKHPHAGNVLKELNSKVRHATVRAAVGKAMRRKRRSARPAPLGKSSTTPARPARRRT